METETKKRELLSPIEREDLQTNPIPVFKWYDRQSKPQPAYIAIEPEKDFPVSASYNGEIGGMSMLTWHGRRLEIPIPAESSGKSIIDFITEHEGLFWQVADGYSCEWDGNNWRGRLTEDANNALEKLTRLAEDEIETVEVWHDISDLQLENYIAEETDARAMARDVLENIETEGQIATFDEDDLTAYIMDYIARAFFEEVHIDDITADNIKPQASADVTDGTLIVATEGNDSNGGSCYVLSWHRGDGMPSFHIETFAMFANLHERMAKISQWWNVRV